MSFFNNLTQFLPFRRKQEKKEYFFAINIGVEKLTASLWIIEGTELKILDIASDNYSSQDEIIAVTDKLLDQVLGLKEIEPQKILFGVPHSWLIDDNLKDEYLKLLRGLVKELELTPMAYVATSNSLIHFLEKQEGVPPTAILVGFEKLHLTVTVVRAGKLDGVKIIARGENSGSDIEKALLTFTDIETLPSKILVYGAEVQELKSQLLSFSWMSKLSFLHFPKIDILGDDIEIKSVCLAGGSEMNSGVSYTDHPLKQTERKVSLEEEDLSTLEKSESQPPETSEKEDNFGFVVGDVESQIKSGDSHPTQSEQKISESEEDQIETSQSLVEEESEMPEETRGEEFMVPQGQSVEIEDFEQGGSLPVSPQSEEHKRKFSLRRFIPRKLTNLSILSGIVLSLVLLLGAYIFLPKAEVKIFVEPKILEKDAQVVADPNQKTVNEEARVIPGQIIDVEVSGSDKESASGKRQIGDPAKGTIVIYNKTSSSQVVSKGTNISSGNIKFTLDTSVTIASQSASDSGITFGKANTTVTAVSIGADGNLSSGSDFTVSDYGVDKLDAKAEGNFSGGTSKDVTVVSSEDEQRLLAKLSSDLRQQAQQKLQEKFPNKKILQEALSEQIISKSYSKNINDQASEFSLNMTIKYKGTAFDDTDLKTIVSKLVTTQIPDGFELDLSQTETQADVSKLEKDGKLIFLARFKAKLIPKIDIDKIRNQIKFKTLTEVENILKGMDNILGSEINSTPNLPKALERLPILSKNIKIEVGLK
ncbi:hypothetical protein A2867_01315 [Candidatus Daviesbacteria bacterium RIFCSPHIGHO2_01_FULL_40_11]|uniref:Uncharacterized protein n=2 Tax=Microgenomates group TaxID=1794810 RepID=A0A1F5JFT2_9BACT|nr:MAG: hypothetical protein A2867_01315 [Candidatus Daviesbacteria bacterium RIFCSPHIGHO2_01_FULL_40_11]OGE62969.1 MAG: hypothetical protein A2964_02000 [Candidatus Daviesbacteria bacterium RIFCSPLOWO2_01_FULL_40_27]